MKYNINKFNNAVKYYQRQLGKTSKKTIFVSFHIENKDAYYSIAPLSRAIHNLGKDLYVSGYYKGDITYQILTDIWKTYHHDKRMDEKIASLIKFVEYVDKKSKGNFKKLFTKPEILVAKASGFESEKLKLDFKTDWIKKRDNWKKLVSTSNIIWKQVYNLNKNEKVGINFELIPKAKDLEKPLEDFLGSFFIADAMAEAVKKKCKNVSMGSSTNRYSITAFPEKISDLMGTLIGCEYEKNIDEPVFKLFKNMSRYFNLDRLTPNDATFAVFGKGTHGKHIFGDAIGYPTKNKKSRWESPGSMFYKLAWAPQSKIETRDPQSRIAFTSTVKIQDFIDTCHVDWFEINRKNQKITDIVDKCEKIVVTGKKSNFTVYLTNGKKRRHAINSDFATRSKINRNHFKRTKSKCGNMANLPGGESFVTPEYIEGVISGDVVINIDDSYRLNKKNPLVIECSKKGYKIVKGPSKIIKKLKERKKEAWNKLIEQGKNKNIPKEIIDLKKNNFEKIGEYAINTNPNAKLSDYLIINEKIANMMHIALGSGFDADRASAYHYDIVFNSKEQKLDAYGVDKKDKKYWIIKKGKFAF